MKAPSEFEPTKAKHHAPHKLQPLSAFDNPDSLLQVSTVQAVTGLGKSTIYTKVREGKFPPPIRLSARCTRFISRDITSWLKAQASA